MYAILAGKLRKNNMHNCNDELFVAEKNLDKNFWQPVCS